MSCKQLDLQKKSPYLPILQLNYQWTDSDQSVWTREKPSCKSSQKSFNESSRAIIGFDVVSRGFGFYETVISIFLMFAGMIMGIALVSNSGSGLYGVAVVYLVTIS